ncbi:hypothetical protein ACF1BQ_044420 [Bradyrhizobium sp. RDT10]
MANAGSAALQRNAGRIITLLSAPLVPVCSIATALLPEIATQGKTMEVNGIAHIFLTASNYERSRDFIAGCCRSSA